MASPEMDVSKPEDEFRDLLARLAEESSAEGAVRSARDPDTGVSGLEGIGAPTPSATPISRAAVDLLIAAEVSSRAWYESKLTRPTWPGGRSGVTVGIGYDVGMTVADKFRTDWSRQLLEQDVAKLASACGVTGASASGLAARLSSVTIGYETAERVFFACSVPDFVGQTEGALLNTGLLGPDCLGALVSLTYNRGPSFNADGDRFREMRAIRLHMTNREFRSIPAELRSMKRIWQGDANAKGLVVRREAEAVLFERGLVRTLPGHP